MNTKDIRARLAAKKPVYAAYFDHVAGVQVIGRVVALERSAFGNGYTLAIEGKGVSPKLDDSRVYFSTRPITIERN